jgi:predicted Zn-dependent protease
MSIRGACGVVFAAAAVMSLGSVPGRERAVVENRVQDRVQDHASQLERLEAAVASHPERLSARIELAQGYLDAASPGLALGALSRIPEAQRHSPSVEHMEARVLIEQGRAKDALALEQHVIQACSADQPAAGCDFWVVVSATRRAEILQALVQRGVEDPIAEPEASLVAYHTATHEARLALE